MNRKGVYPAGPSLTQETREVVPGLRIASQKGCTGSGYEGIIPGKKQPVQVLSPKKCLPDFLGLW